MIVVDTSALIAVLAEEPSAAACDAVLRDRTDLCISAGTLTEAMIVALGRRISVEMEQLLARLAIEIVPVSAETARRAADGYTRWGRGYHPAALNFGDCFAYALAMERGAPLLFVGNDFNQTDVTAVLAA